MKRISLISHPAFYLLLACCLFSSMSAHASAQPVLATQPETVTLQLKWFHQFQFAGYYAAIEKGYYQEAGLNVVLKEGKPGLNWADEVIAGRADYGIEMSSLLLERFKKKPVVVIATIFQHSPESIISREDSGIITPHDLINKRLMLSPKGSFESRAMLFNEGVQENQLNISDHSWNLNDLVEKRVDASSSYITDVPFMMQQRHVAYSIMYPLNYGIDFYGDSLFTTEKEISKHPKRVEAFLAASLKGWSYAMANPQEIVDLILKKYRTKLSREALLFEAQAMQELIQPKFIQIGHMNPGRWKHIADTFVRLKMLDPQYSLDGFLYDPASQSQQRKFIKIVWGLLAAVTLMFIVALILFIFNRKLNKKVQARTRHLTSEIAERIHAEKALTASELFLNSVVENIPNMIFVKHAKCLSYVRLNKAGEELLGYPKETFLGKTDYDLFPKEEADFFTKKDREVLNNKTLLFIEQESVQTHSNEIRILSTKKIPILDEQGEPLYLLGISEDITEKKDLEAKLRQSQKMEAIGTLAGGIAHDFNNILTAIMGYTELAQGDIKDQNRLQSDLDEIYKGANRAKELVKQILTFSRKSDQRLQPIRVQVISKEVLKLLNSSLPATIQIRQNIDQNCPAVLANPTQLHQIVMNLCTNAYHAMRDNGGVLVVSVLQVVLSGADVAGKLHLQPGSYVKLVVSDSGTGMPKDVLENIFEPYYTTKKKGEGTGLGLAVVHGIVTSLDGDISVYSELGAGTTFSIYIPIVGGLRSYSPENINYSTVMGSENILLVDDDETIVRLNKTVLEKFGYSVTALSSSLETLKTFNQNPQKYDLVITDMTMPDMTGAELARKIIITRPDMPIILCSGFSELINEEKAKAIGIRCYVEKPVNQNDFTSTIRKVLDAQKNLHHTDENSSTLITENS